MRPTTCALAFVSVLAASSPGQNTWIVDANNGSGTQFRDLPPAIAAAAPGDRILVRAGTYGGAGGGVTITKPLSILGEPGAVVAGGFVFGLIVQGIPAGTTLAVRGLEVTTIPVGTAVSLADCPGTVLLENLTCSTRVSGRRLADLRLVGCTTGPIDVSDAAVALERCSVSSPNAHITLGCLDAVDSQLVVSRCVIRGSDGVLGPGGPAITIDNCSAMIMGDGSGALTAGLGTVPTSAIDGNGLLLIDPNVVLMASLGARPIAATINAAVLPLPSLAATGSAIGGTVQVDLFAAPAQVYALVVGGLAPAAAVSGLVGTVWLRDPLLVRTGIVGASQRVGLAVPVPRDPMLIGVSFCWQAVTVDSQGLAVLSNPGTYVHHP